MPFFNVFKAPRFALVNSASQSNATGLENVENDMFATILHQYQSPHRLWSGEFTLSVLGDCDCTILKSQSS